MTAPDPDIERRNELLRGTAASAPGLSFLEKFRERVPEGEWFLVGGAVRDTLLGRDMPADIDLVARNVPVERLAEVLGELGTVDLVGRSFGVLKFTAEGSDAVIDIALPRTELARGTGGYRDFDVAADEELPIEDDLGRRDLTVNAMAWDIFGERLVDPYGGTDDLAARTVRAVGTPEDRFDEDLSRMLRCIRFACQLGFDIDGPTWDAVRSRSGRINETRSDRESGENVRLVAYETVAKELVKALDADPVRAIDLFERSGLLFAVLPELAEMSRTPQSPDHHSEGDAWRHTALAIGRLHGSEFASWFPEARPDVQTTLAVLLHDVGKPATRGEKDGHITFYGHDAKGAEIAADIFDRLRLTSVAGYDIDRDRICRIVRLHLLPNMVDLDAVKRTTLHKHFLAEPDWGRRLLYVAFADAAASIPEGGEPDLVNLRALMDRLEDMRRTMDGKDEPERLADGDDVMAIAGIGAGPEVGRIMDALKEAQLRGEVRTEEEAKTFIREHAIGSVKDE